MIASRWLGCSQKPPASSRAILSECGSEVKLERKADGSTGPTERILVPKPSSPGERRAQLSGRAKSDSLLKDQEAVHLQVVAGLRSSSSHRGQVHDRHVTRRRLEEARQRLLDLFLLSTRRDSREQLLEIRMGDATRDEGVALGVEHMRVDVLQGRRTERAVQIALQILDVEAGLLLQQTVHGTDKLDQIRDGGVPLFGPDAAEGAQRLEMVHAGV